MNNNHGITIVELVIVMIIMILLVSFAVYSGIDSVGKAEATELYAEMNSLKNAVGGVMTQKFLLSGDDEWLKSYYDESVGNGWYLIYGIGDPGYESSSVRKKLEMDSIKRNYMVSYESGEVMLSVPAEVLGVSVRTYDSVRALVESEKI